LSKHKHCKHYYELLSIIKEKDDTYRSLLIPKESKDKIALP